jgi:hypothetical protein
MTPKHSHTLSNSLISITHLYLRRVGLTNKTASILSDGIGKLELFDIRDNFLGGEGFWVVAEAFRGSVLKLSGNERIGWRFFECLKNRRLCNIFLDEVEEDDDDIERNSGYFVLEE